MNRKKKGKNKVMTIAIIGPGAVGTTLAFELKKSSTRYGTHRPAR